MCKCRKKIIINNNFCRNYFLNSFYQENLFLKKFLVTLCFNSRKYMNFSVEGHLFRAARVKKLFPILAQQNKYVA